MCGEVNLFSDPEASAEFERIVAALLIECCNEMGITRIPE